MASAVASLRSATTGTAYPGRINAASIVDDFDDDRDRPHYAGPHACMVGAVSDLPARGALLRAARCRDRSRCAGHAAAARTRPRPPSCPPRSPRPRSRGARASAKRRRQFAHQARKALKHLAQRAEPAGSPTPIAATPPSTRSSNPLLRTQRLRQCLGIVSRVGEARGLAQSVLDHHQFAREGFTSASIRSTSTRKACATTACAAGPSGEGAAAASPASPRRIVPEAWQDSRRRFLRQDRARRRLQPPAPAPHARHGEGRWPRPAPGRGRAVR